MVSTICLIQNDSPPPPRKKTLVMPLEINTLSQPFSFALTSFQTLDWEREELQVYSAFLRGMLQ